MDIDEQRRAGMAALWGSVKDRYQAYELVLPGDPSFICQPHVCDAHCCRRFSVAIDDGEVERMERASGLAPIVFLESADGAPVKLPLRKPYLLARRDGHCALLASDLSCSQYTGRPDACRSFPYQVVWIDPAGGRTANWGREVLLGAVADVLKGVDPAPAPLLLRHIECPGFTGAPIESDGWRALLRETAESQLREG